MGRISCPAALRTKLSTPISFLGMMWVRIDAVLIPLHNYVATLLTAIFKITQGLLFRGEVSNTLFYFAIFQSCSIKEEFERFFKSSI